MSILFSEWFMQFGLTFLVCVIAITGVVELISYTNGSGRLSGSFGNSVIAVSALAVALHRAPPRMTDRDWIVVNYILDCIFVNVIFFIVGLIVLDIIQRLSKRPLRDYAYIVAPVLFVFTTVLGVSFSPEWPL